MKILHVLAIVTFLAACSSGQPSSTETRLPSGKVVKILGVGTMHFTGDAPALMLKYQTDCSLDDKQALQREVDEIWAVFRADAERANVTNAIVSANEPPEGAIVTTNRSFNFVFRRSKDGTWTQLEARANKALDPAHAADPKGQPRSPESAPPA